MSSVTFRPAAPGDEELMLSFIRALADYEHMTDQVVATPALLREWIFEKKKAAAKTPQLFIPAPGKIWAHKAPGFRPSEWQNTFS